MSLSSMEQKMQTVIVRQKMSTLDEEGRLRKVLDVFLLLSVHQLIFAISDHYS
jgi:hypothetical protein